MARSLGISNRATFRGTACLMKREDFIALALGLIAAVAFVSATAGPLPMRLILFLITPLPLALAGLGWGVRAALVAGLAGSILLAAAGPMVAAVFIVSQALPAAVLTYLALLNRPAAAADEDLDAPETAPPVPAAREWYPPGRLVVWAAIMAAVPAVIWSLLADANSAEIKSMLATALDAAFKAGAVEAPGGGQWTPEAIARVSAVIYAVLPGGSAIAWMSGLLLALWLAGRVMLASGQLMRPWPDLARLEFPAGTALAFMAVALAAFVEGYVGIAGRAFFGALLLAYLLMGLAVIHFITRGSAARPFMLGVLYTALLFASGLAAIPVALIGLSEPFLHLRRRFGQPPGST